VDKWTISEEQEGLKVMKSTFFLGVRYADRQGSGPPTIFPVIIGTMMYSDCSTGT